MYIAKAIGVMSWYHRCRGGLSCFEWRSFPQSAALSSSAACTFTMWRPGADVLYSACGIPSPQRPALAQACCNLGRATRASLTRPI